MLINKNQKLALIHTAKRDLGLDDECYRLLLQSCTGVDSAKDITTEKQFDDIMAAFKKLGFVSTSNTRGVKCKETVLGREPSLISKRQEYYIRAALGFGKQGERRKEPASYNQAHRQG